MRNKRGWLKIVEAFFAILLIAGVLAFVLSKGYLKFGGTDAEKIQEIELSVLREIELNDEFRGKILRVNLYEGAGAVPEDIKEKINSRMPDYLECESKLCQLNMTCSLSKYVDKEVYANSVVIAAENTIYYPRLLKIFCWQRS